MSYNVTTWITKELVDLKIPVNSLFKCSRKDWHPEMITKEDSDVVMFYVAECCNIEGTIEDEILSVSSIIAHGVGSSTALDWVFEPALQDSTGKLVASRVWEGGDHIDRLIVENGELTKEEIEL